MSNKLFGAIAILVGTIVGAGIFGLPYAISRVGLLVGIIYLVILGIVVFITVLAYGEVVLRTREESQMTGYAGKYLGIWGKRILSFTLVFSIYGALLAYTIGVGDFLNTLFETSFGGTPFLYSILFFVLASLCVLAGLRTVVSLEKIITSIVIFAILLIGALTFSHIRLENFFNFDKQYLFLPYGIILFAFAGATAVADMKKVLKGEEKKLKKAILIGHIIPFAIYLLFVVFIVGVTGLNTSQEAIFGLKEVIGPKVAAVGAVLGILTMTTSFLILALVLKEIFIFDYRIRKFFAWFWAMIIPFVVFIFGLASFIKIIGLVGAVVGGIDGIIILMMYKKAKRLGNQKPAYSFNLPNFVYYLLLLVFGLGILYEIWFSFFGKI
jgi:tyrosine-specific transport protein